MAEIDPTTPEQPEERKVVYTPELSGRQESSNSRVDWKSVGIFGRTIGIVSAVALGGTLIYQETTQDTDSTAPPSQNQSLTSTIQEKPKICQDVRGILRIVGVDKEQVAAVNDADDVGKIPDMRHERGEGEYIKDVDVDKFELRWKPDVREQVDYNDRTEFWVSVNNHFRPYPEQEEAKLLDKGDSVLDREFNLGPNTVAQVIQYGSATVCQ